MRGFVRAALLLWLLLPGSLYAQGRTFTVNTTNDADDGVCDAGHCSLREAIGAANANAGPDTIAFAIAGPGTRRIQPASALPAITDPVYIDGTTQPGFADSPLIELAGAGTGPGTAGLLISGAGSTVKGLAISGFTFGLVIDGGAGNTIGGVAASESNVISGNDSTGVLILGAGATSNSVQWNTITGNGGAGVALAGAGSGNTITFNSIFDNGGLGIDLGADGVTANDAGDTDAGPNGLQNFPELHKVVFGVNRAEGSLSTTPNTQLWLEFFGSTSCDPSGYGEGRTVFGGTSIATDANGDAEIAFTLLGNVPLGEYITVTATDSGGSTSEFSNCVPATTFAVTISPDSGKTQRGGSEDYAVFITPAGGAWGQTVSLSCDNLPGLTTCEFTPPSFALDTAEVRSNLIITTTKLAAAQPPARDRGDGPGPEPGAPRPAYALLLGLLGLALPAAALAGAGRAVGRRRRRLSGRFPAAGAGRRRVVLGLAAGAALLAAALHTGCGGVEITTGVVEAGTPRGRHTIVVVASSESLVVRANLVLVVE